MSAEKTKLSLAPDDDAVHRDKFDMLDDDDDLALVASWPVLHDALTWLHEHVGKPYETADSAALSYQTSHRRIGRTAIVAGTAAIVLAIVQLALKQSWPQLLWGAGLLEVIAVVAGLISVCSGLWWKYDRQWLQQRHRAERLRMLKFQSLARPELWRDDLERWQAWVNEHRQRIDSVSDFSDIEAWCHEGRAEIDPLSTEQVSDPARVRALAAYYLRKRVNYQACYFKKQSARHAKQVGRLRHFGLPLFFASVISVLVHFGADVRAHTLIEIGQTDAAQWWELIAVWALALAAALPVIGVGVRTWTTAMEHARSASLFAAKHQALVRVHKHIEQDATDSTAVMRHIAHVEYFLENEHREWLRLLLDAEWFL